MKKKFHVLYFVNDEKSVTTGITIDAENMLQCVMDFKNNYVINCDKKLLPREEAEKQDKLYSPVNLLHMKYVVDL